MNSTQFDADARDDRYAAIVENEDLGIGYPLDADRTEDLRD